jgi:catechol 2,3-dioxygenase-like lactoylglutathione lyase family enzyme
MTGQRPRGLTPHLFVRDADGAVAFYRTAFGAAELLRTSLPDGRVLFVELAVGAGRLLLSEETPSLNALAPPTIGGSPVLLPVPARWAGWGAVGAVLGGAALGSAGGPVRPASSPRAGSELRRLRAGRSRSRGADRGAGRAGPVARDRA